MLRRALLLAGLGVAMVGAAQAEPASLEEVKAAIAIFYPGAAFPGPIQQNLDLSAVIAMGLEGDWYRPDYLGTVEPAKVRTACDRGPIRITTAPNEITLVQASKPGPVTYRYTYVGGSLFSEWVDIPALFARLGMDRIPDEEKRRMMEMTMLRSNSGFVVIVRASENVLWMYSLAGGPRLYARCG